MLDSLPALEDALSTPEPAVINTLRNLQGDIILLGAGGKMGPTLARMAKRASVDANTDRRIIAVSRFTNAHATNDFQSHGIETIQCDLLDRSAIDALPDAPNVIFMTGMKFGASDNPGLTWAMNTHVPAMIGDRYRTSRIVAFSTGNIYGMVPIDSGGSRETDTSAPDGEYAMSALGRERIFEYASRQYKIPTAIIRLNYACELRYGVLVDIAQWVYNNQPVPLATGHLNAIWQRDANACTLRAFGHTATPPFVINIAGPETLSVRQIAQQFADRMNRTVQFQGEESNTAYLSNATKMQTLFGQPQTTTDQMIDNITHWITNNQPTHNKPTHFETRSGKF